MREEACRTQSVAWRGGPFQAPDKTRKRFENREREGGAVILPKTLTCTFRPKKAREPPEHSSEVDVLPLLSYINSSKIDSASHRTPAGPTFTARFLRNGETTAVNTKSRVCGQPKNEIFSKGARPTVALFSFRVE